MTMATLFHGYHSLQYQWTQEPNKQVVCACKTHVSRFEYGPNWTSIHSQQRVNTSIGRKKKKACHVPNEVLSVQIAKAGVMLP